MFRTTFVSDPVRINSDDSDNNKNDGPFIISTTGERFFILFTAATRARARVQYVDGAGGTRRRRRRRQGEKKCVRTYGISA